MHFLASLPEADSIEAPGTKGNESLPLLKPLAVPVFFRVRKSHEPLNPLGHGQCDKKNGSESHRSQNRKPTQSPSGHEDHSQSRSADEGCVADVHLEKNQDHRNGENRDGKKKAVF